jgi:hypothetical protein
MAHMYWPRAAVDIVLWPAVRLDEISLSELKTELAGIGAKIRRECKTGG